MNLLLFSPDRSDLAEVSSYFDVWSHFLAREFKALGISIRYEPLYENGEISDLTTYFRDLPLAGADHIFAIGLRYFSMLPRAAVDVLRGRFSGAIAQYNDAALDETPVDFTFCARDLGVDRPGSRFVGWAADAEICAPRQDPDELRILIDHPDYSPGREDLDRSVAIIRDVAGFVRSGQWRRRFKNVRVRRCVDGGVEDCDLDRRAVAPFSRKHIPYAQMCAEYCKTHIFLPTHEESLGLTVLETATAGALQVARFGMIPADRLMTVRHVIYSGGVPWRRVMDKIDVAASREIAARNSWAMVAGRILGHLAAFRR